jgi:hypothetical protein
MVSYCNSTEHIIFYYYLGGGCFNFYREETLETKIEEDGKT